MSFLDKTIEEFSSETAAKQPAPGGGGAAALVGSLAAALSSMAAVYSAGKCGSEEDDERLKALSEKAEGLRKDLLKLVDADAQAFVPLSEVYKMSDDDPEKPEAMENALRDAAQVPMQTLVLACRTIKLTEDMLTLSTDLMLSDVGCAAVLAWSAMYAAVLNVRVNTKLMADREYAEKMNSDADELMGSYWKIADEVYENIYAKLK